MAYTTTSTTIHTTTTTVIAVTVFITPRQKFLRARVYIMSGVCCLFCAQRNMFMEQDMTVIIWHMAMVESFLVWFLNPVYNVLPTKRFMNYKERLDLFSLASEQNYTIPNYPCQRKA